MRLKWSKSGGVSVTVDDCKVKVKVEFEWSGKGRAGPDY